MSFRVQLDTGEAFDVQAGQSLLSAALNASMSLPSYCLQGACGTWCVKLLEGRVAYEEPPMALTPEEEAAGLALACQARASSDLLIRIESAVLSPAARHIANIRAVGRFTADVIHLELERPRRPITCRGNT